jgi:Helicase associated domain
MIGYCDSDPFAPLSLNEPLPLTPLVSRPQVTDRLLGDRSEASGASVPTVVSMESYGTHQQGHQAMMSFSNTSTTHNYHNSNPMDHYQRHNPITPTHSMSPKPTLGSVTSSSSLAKAAPVASLGGDVKGYDDDDDDDELNQHRFKPFHEEKWSLRYKELLDFFKQHGHAAVPHTYPANPQLARWVKRQRRQYKLRRENRQSTMTTERLDLLTSVGFIWDSHDVNWREKLDSLAVFRKEHAHCNVPSNYRDKKLATWVKCQRRQYKLYWDGKPSAMSPDRILELEKVGFEWEIRSTVPRNNSNNAAASAPVKQEDFNLLYEF